MEDRQKLEVVKYMERNRKRRSEEIGLMGQIHGQQQRMMMAVMEMLAEEEQTETEETRGVWGGRKAGSKNYRRGNSNWYRDYLGDNPTYPAYVFRRRFGIPRTLYYKVREDLLTFNNEEWRTKMIGNTRPGIPTDIKLLLSLKILRYGGGTDQWDDAAYMSEESGRIYLMKFCKDIIDMYGSTYLKR